LADLHKNWYTDQLKDAEFKYNNQNGVKALPVLFIDPITFRYKCALRGQRKFALQNSDL